VNWLSSEGYPLEYYTAGRFSFCRFHVTQGEYVRIRNDDHPKEIDVVADMVIESDNIFIRASNVIECKWSLDKPWIIFTTTLRGQMNPTAVIAQTIGSQVGDALLWMLCGNEKLKNLSLFKSPRNPGFGGRQAFASKNDLFYATMASLTSNCVAMAGEYDRKRRSAEKSLSRYGLITFPVVVIDGRLFEASYDSEAGHIETKEVNTVRCHWRGSPSWPLHATVDIVTREGLPCFVEKRAADFKILLPALAEAAGRLQAAHKASDWSLLQLSKGATGRGGRPPILQKIMDETKKRESEAG
jgi:hypothetical protein